MTTQKTEAPKTDLPGLDLARFAAHYESVRPGELGPDLTATLIAGGKSNLTYRLTDGTRRLVVRRPPLGHVLSTAHDMSREFTVMSALAGTDVPVPGVHLLCEDPDVLGASFYVMDEIAGHTYRDAEQLVEVGPERTEKIALELVDTLARLHAVDPTEVGLESFGRPAGFLPRQVRRWTTQLEASHHRPLAGATELAENLAASIPDEIAPTIVHGDFRLDNALVGDDDSILAVLDWEMATLGDPLTDVALMLTYQRVAGLPGGDRIMSATNAPGHPDVAALTERYAATSGRDVSALSWYVALAHFKLAVILEGIDHRFAQGQTVGEGFDRVGDLVEPLLAAGLAAWKELS
ncbi:phosphotransferase family protein [Nocardioides sp. Soil796]|uniref:phosphotransferase family protein n=1 Tax=Nocardioides sp. Soil796 TaxID=1736412 RepID=UPI00070B12D0|nr:phosphotransferase family protein [Nocardioides sp. Soil796]KRF10381.1 acyl-CoA dehydrogenase [Nocardioides sp. Soil796]